eukprot:1779974-Amphidinium_carterae.1
MVTTLVTGLVQATAMKDSEHVVERLQQNAEVLVPVMPPGKLVSVCRVDKMDILQELDDQSTSVMGILARRRLIRELKLTSQGVSVDPFGEEVLSILGVQELPAAEVMATQSRVTKFMAEPWKRASLNRYFVNRVSLKALATCENENAD